MMRDEGCIRGGGKQAVMDRQTDRLQSAEKKCDSPFCWSEPGVTGRGRRASAAGKEGSRFGPPVSLFSSPPSLFLLPSLPHTDHFIPPSFLP